MYVMHHRLASTVYSSVDHGRAQIDDGATIDSNVARCRFGAERTFKTDITVPSVAAVCARRSIVPAHLARRNFDVGATIDGDRRRDGTDDALESLCRM